MTDDEIIAVVQEHKEGKQIQRVLRDSNCEWIDVIEACWDFDHYNYRVAPEPRKPREWKIPVTPSGCIAYLTTEPVALVRVREVID